MAMLMLAGCAARPAVMKVDAIAPDKLEQAVVAEAEHNRRELRQCVVDLAARHDLEWVAVDVSLDVRNRMATVLQVRPRDRATVVDAGLAACVQRTSDEWQLDGRGIADLTLQLQLPPIVRPDPVDVMHFALLAKFRPAE